ncbi:MAG: Bug family tripartite tricarboxylate transporter substrate binding protein, partial [Panacagrimonas sp.]
MIKALTAFSLALFAVIAGAQSYPTRPVTLISPFPPGGSTDTTARIIADAMRGALGQTVVIETVAGAGGTIGVGRVARAAPDGYTIDIGQWDTHVGNGAIYALPYDLQKDFEPIGLISVNPQLLVGKKALPADDLKGLVAWMKANPGKTTFVNQNAAAQVTGILFQQATGTQVQFIPYRGAGPAMQDLIGGRIDYMCDTIQTGAEQANGGTVKGIAVMGPSRVSIIDLPTTAEAGLDGVDATV